MLIYDRVGVKGYLRIDDVGDPHDVLLGEDSIAVVCPASNAVVWLSRSGTIRRRVDLPGDADAWHVNSIHERQGRLFASAFGRWSRSRQWSEPESPAEAGLIFDLDTLRPVVTGLSQPHHPRFVDGLWCVCNSGKNEILAVGDGDGRVHRRAILSGFTRGLAFADEYVFVGVSASRKQTGGCRAHIAVLDRASWELLEQIPLPVQEIYDITFAPPDLLKGFRTGFNTNPQRTAEQAQLSMFWQIGVENPTTVFAVGDPLLPEDCSVSLDAQIPPTMQCDVLCTVDVRLQNLGRTFLVSAPPNPVFLSYKWLDVELGRFPDDRVARRTPLPSSLAPNAGTATVVRILAPTTPGRYQLSITLVQEHVAWFDEIHPCNGVTAEVTVTASPAAGNRSTEELRPLARD